MRNDYTPQLEEKVKADIDAEIAQLSADRQELLRRIFEPLHYADLHETARLQTTIGRFATLLCSLSVLADKVQKTMVRLTIAITVMTFVLVVLTLVMLYKMP